ncbi:MAG TPA: hypothetical protein VKS78_07205 [Roseiarcus sp.]|nr:hypothetical protein [Roseiarcus sp.]
MSDALRIDFTRAEAARRRAVYRGILGANLAIIAALGVIALLAPAAFAGLAGATAGPFIRLWGTFLIIVAALYFPGWLDPLTVRWPNVIGVGARVVLALVYLLLGGGFLWLALFELAFAVALGWAYSRFVRAELMSRP